MYEAGLCERHQERRPPVICPPIDFVACEAGRLLDSVRGRGRDPCLADMLIAATARIHRLTLLTRNVRDFDGSGVKVVDPFEGINASQGRGLSGGG